MLVHTAKHHGRPWEKLHRAAGLTYKKILGTWDHDGPYLAREHHSVPSQPSKLNEVLHITLKEAAAWVQPNVTMGSLVETTMRAGRIPAVVAGSKSTAVLEAFATKACGSLSFKNGTFGCAVLSVKIVSHDGQELTINPNDQNAVDRQFGKSGVPHNLITLLEISLIRAGDYVEMTYWPVGSVEGAALRMMPKSRKSLIVDRPAVNEFTDLLDVIMFGSSSGVVVTGQFMPAADHTCSLFGDDIPFVQHAESIYYKKLQPSRDVHIETVPLMDYLFRYDGSITQDDVDIGQNVVLSEGSLEEYVEDSYWQNSSCPVSIIRRQPPSTFGRRAALDGDLWHIRAFESASKEESH